jgi:hypothetical protein
MDYIVSRRFKTKAICGPVNLPRFTECQTAGQTITWGGKPLCRVTSQNAYDHFARNDDGQGIVRGALTQKIINRLKLQRNHQERWDILWADKGANKLRRAEHADFWVWGYDFYNAEVPELERIWNLIKEV